MPTIVHSEPQPPDSHIRNIGYHCLQPRSGRDGTPTPIYTLQWNPDRKQWFKSGHVDATTPSVNTAGWKYISPSDKL